MQLSIFIKESSFIFLCSIFFVNVSQVGCGEPDENKSTDGPCKLAIDQVEYNATKCGNIPTAESFFTDVKDATSLIEFAANGYTWIRGSLRILESTDINNLVGLEAVKCIEGNLNIVDNQALASTKGLDNLEFVGRDFIITNNQLLTNLDGLQKLSQVGDELVIGDLRRGGNPVLTDVSALVNLTTIGKTFWIGNNDSLENLDGLNNINAVGQFFGLFANGVLTSIEGLSSLKSIGGFINIAENLSLPTCQATSLYQQLTTFCGDVCVRKNLTDSCESFADRCWYP